MIHACALMLKTDTIEYLDWVAAQLSRQRNAEVSRSEAVEYIVSRHWMKQKTRAVEHIHDARVKKRVTA